MKRSNERRPLFAGDEALQQLRDLGGRLEYIVERYRRMVADAAAACALPDVKDSVELMNHQLGYVARRLQELLVAQYEGNVDGAGVDGQADVESHRVAVAR